MLVVAEVSTSSVGTILVQILKVEHFNVSSVL